jgi:hypothetical protein
MSIFTSSTASVNQGQSVITCTDSVDFSSLPSGSLVFIDYNKVVVADSGTAVVGVTSTINLRDPYPGTLPNVSNGKIIVTAGVPALVEAVNKVNTVSQNLTTTKADLQTIIDAQGTAATSDVTTSSTDTTAGSITKVGDFGWGVSLAGSSTAIISDFNTALISGSFFVNGTTSNGPKGLTAIRGTLLVQRETVSHGSQLFIDRDLNEIWVRRYDNSVWASWVEIWHTGNLVKTTSATDTTAGSLLKVSDGGLLSVNGMSITSFSSDANNAIYNGWYDVSSGTVTNLPVAKAGVLFTASRTADRLQQMFYVAAGDTDDSVYTRSYTGTVWQSWKKIWNSGNLVKTTISTDTTAGSLLQVGDHGLGAVAAPLVTNWDNVQTGGIYQSIAASQVNSPNDAYAGWVGTVGALNIGNTFQMVWRAGSAALEVYTRFYADPTWTPWASLYHSGNLVKTTSYNDTTAGSISKVGDFGSGDTGLNPVIADALLIAAGGTYKYNTGVTINCPVGTVVGTIFAEIYASDTKTLFLIEAANNNLTAVNRQINGAWLGWEVFYHSGNTNLNEFGGVATDDILAQGSVRHATVAQFVLPINLLAAPSSITVTGTFKLLKPDLTVVASGVTPALNSASGNKVAFITFTISGGTANDSLLLQCTDATSKIVVNA